MTTSLSYTSNNAALSSFNARNWLLFSDCRFDTLLFENELTKKEERKSALEFTFTISEYNQRRLPQTRNSWVYCSVRPLVENFADWSVDRVTQLPSVEQHQFANVWEPMYRCNSQYIHPLFDLWSLYICLRTRLYASDNASESPTTYICMHYNFARADLSRTSVCSAQLNLAITYIYCNLYQLPSLHFSHWVRIALLKYEDVFLSLILWVFWEKFKMCLHRI